MTGDASLPAAEDPPRPRAGEDELCPTCGAVLVVTDDAEVCRTPGCDYLVVLLACRACGVTRRWRYGQPRPAWWRLRLVDGPGSITVCSAACGVLVFDQLASDGQIAVEPQGPGEAG